MKKALFIGGTGKISTAVVALAQQSGWDVTLLNRGMHLNTAPQGVRILHADAHDEDAVNAVLGDETFDVVAQFIGFTPAHAATDIALYKNRTKQYIYISSTAAYQRPLLQYHITESTPLINPYWQYSRDKIASEELLLAAYQKDGFPVTIVRPGHTYANEIAPPAVRGPKGGWAVLSRILAGKPVIIHGDGTSLWTMTHASDFAKGFVGLMRNMPAIGNAFHISCDEVMTWNQIYELYAQALGKPLKAVHVTSDFLGEMDDQGFGLYGSLLGDKNASVVLDNTKLKQFVPTFACTVSMSDGILGGVEYMLTHPASQIEDPAFDMWCDRVIAAQQAARDYMKAHVQ